MAEKHNDFALVDQYLSGKRVSGEKLFADTYRKVKAFVFKNTSNSQLNESEKKDIISESLYVAVEKLSVYDGTCAFATYVISIAKRIIQVKYRKKGIEVSNVVELSSVIDLEIGSLIGKSPEHVLIKKEEKEIIIREVDGDNTYPLYLKHPFQYAPDFAAVGVNYSIEELKQTGEIILLPTQTKF